MHLPSSRPAGRAFLSLLVGLLLAVPMGHAGEGGDEPAADRPLVGTRWLLVEIDGRPAGVGTSGRPADLILNAGGHGSGYAGCNRFSGGVKVEGDHLVFGPMMSTMMACAEGDEVEQAYLAKLVGTVRFSVSGEELVFYDGDDSRPVLRFRAEQDVVSKERCGARVS